MSAGAIGQAIAVPCDLIKVRMQSDGRLVAAGKLEAPRYTGLMDAFTKIRASEGMYARTIPGLPPRSPALCDGAPFVCTATGDSTSAPLLA